MLRFSNEHFSASDRLIEVETIETLADQEVGERRRTRRGCGSDLRTMSGRGRHTATQTRDGASPDVRVTIGVAAFTAAAATTPAATVQ
jgi:hypothetical protein